MDCNTYAVTVGRVSFRPVNIPAQHLWISFFNILCRYYYFNLNKDRLYRLIGIVEQTRQFHARLIQKNPLISRINFQNFLLPLIINQHLMLDIGAIRKPIPTISLLRLCVVLGLVFFFVLLGGWFFGVCCSSFSLLLGALHFFYFKLL